MPARVETHDGANFLKWGDNNVISDRSGFKVKASECKFEWQGLFVPKTEWEARHPQDFVRGVADDQTVKVSRPESPDVFLGTNEVTRDDL